MVSAAVSACEKSWQSDMALALFQQARNSCRKLDSIIYSAAISASHRGRRWAESLRLLRDASILWDGPGLDIGGHNAVLSALGEGSMQWELSLAFLCEMRLCGATPDVVSYGATLGPLGIGERWVWALQLMSEMRRANIETDGFALCLAVGACRRASQCSVAASFLLQIQQWGVRQLAIEGPLRCRSAYGENLVAFGMLRSFQALDGFVAGIFERQVFLPLLHRLCLLLVGEQGLRSWRSPFMGGVSDLGSAYTLDALQHLGVAGPNLCSLPQSRYRTRHLRGLLITQRSALATGSACTLKSAVCGTQRKHIC